MFTIENNIIKGVDKKIDLVNKSIGEIILNKFNGKPNHVAQLEAETGKQTTFAEMQDSIIRCSLWMQKEGIGSGDVVAICTHNHLDAYIPCIAALFVGAIYNPWYHEVPLSKIKSYISAYKCPYLCAKSTYVSESAIHLMSVTRPKVIFSCKNAVKVLIEAARVKNVDTRIIVFGKYPEKISLRDIMKLQTNEEVRLFQLPIIKDPSSVALILFSSGTTGLPKGVAHSYNSLLQKITAFANLSTEEHCVSLWYSSLYWTSGTNSMLKCIVTGATRVIHANFNPEETCKIIEKFQVNKFFIPPSTITHWYKSNILKKYKLKSLKSIITVGAKLSRQILEDLNKVLPHVTVAQGYGMTELGGIVTFQTKECKRIESVGFILPNVQLKIIDVTTGEALGSNQPGEICIKSPTVMVGYYKNLEATKATIDNEGWLHSGDKAYYAENGEFFIIDRLKEIMKFRGHQISPFEIEEMLMGHSAVIEAAVVSIPHELDLERPMAFIKKIPGSKVTEEELIELSSTLGDNKKLSGGIKFLDELPYTTSGKLSRKDLKEMAKSFIKESLNKK